MRNIFKNSKEEMEPAAFYRSCINIDPTFITIATIMWKKNPKDDKLSVGQHVTLLRRKNMDCQRPFEKCLGKRKLMRTQSLIQNNTQYRDLK